MELNLWNQLSTNMNTLKNEFDFLSTSKSVQNGQNVPKTDSKEFRQQRVNTLFAKILEAIDQLQNIKREESAKQSTDKELAKIFSQLKRSFKKNAKTLSSIQEDLEDNRDCYLMTNVY